MKTHQRVAELFLYSFLAIAVSAPALAILVGSYQGQLRFILYREPKLSALQILGSVFLILLVGIKWSELTPRALDTLRQPFFLAMALFIAYGATTYFWTLAPANLFYELRQYIFLFAFLITVHAWARRDPAVARVLLYSLVFSLVPLVLIGFAQSVVTIPGLQSIDPGYGVTNASFMGYKNPMALSLLGHFFLLLYVTFESFLRHTRLLIRLALTGYAFAELAYLISLQSRSVYFSLAVSCAGLGGAFLIKSHRRRHFAAVAAALAALIAALWLLLLMNPAAKARGDSLREYLRTPSSFLESDRGTYLRNTLNMVDHNPFGVGLGDWQTHYPVYRRFNRDLAFTTEHQVRRAHSDHVQFLGELGYGTALWLALLSIAVIQPLRHYLKTGTRLSLFLAIQLLAFAVAMATDYVSEIPYNKFQFFLVCGLATISCRSREKNVPPGFRVPKLLAIAALAAWILLGVANVWYYSQQLAKNYRAAMLNVLYLVAVEELNAGNRARADAGLVSVERYGEMVSALAGHSKTLYKDYLALAHASFLQGRSPRAIELVRESLKLHPFHPKSFGLLATIFDPHAAEKAERYRRIERLIMDQASAGWRHSYPRFFRASPPPSEAPAAAPEAGRRGDRAHWRSLLGGRTLEYPPDEPRSGAGHTYLFFCRDGRFYSQTQDPETIVFGWWRIRARRGGALAELRPADDGEPYLLSLSTSGTSLLVDGRAAELWDENEVCE